MVRVANLMKNNNSKAEAAAEAVKVDRRRDRWWQCSQRVPLQARYCIRSLLNCIRTPYIEVSRFGGAIR